jgi:hypothetical protein
MRYRLDSNSIVLFSVCASKWYQNFFIPLQVPPFLKSSHISSPMVGLYMEVPRKITAPACIQIRNLTHYCNHLQHILYDTCQNPLPVEGTLYPIVSKLVEPPTWNWKNTKLNMHLSIACPPPPLKQGVRWGFDVWGPPPLGSSLSNALNYFRVKTAGKIWGFASPRGWGSFSELKPTLISRQG